VVFNNEYRLQLDMSADTNLIRLTYEYQSEEDSDPVQIVGKGGTQKARIDDIAKQIAKLRSPARFILTTTDRRGLGDREGTEYRTSWVTQFSQPEKFAQDIIYDYTRSSFDIGRQLFMLMPWNIPNSHVVGIMFIGRNLFQKKRYDNIRMYGSVDVKKESLVLVNAKGEVLSLDGVRQNKEFQLLFPNVEDVELWNKYNRDVTVHETKEVKVREAMVNIGVHGVYMVREHRRIFQKEYLQSAVFEKTPIGYMRSRLTTVNLARENQLRAWFSIFAPHHGEMWNRSVRKSMKVEEDDIKYVWKKITGNRMPSDFPF
jgi:hypothetical protein